MAALATRAFASASPPVYVFPIAGGHVASPETQLTFRGVPPGALEEITVVGSKTGLHQGRIEGDSDGRGGSFLPAQPFAADEVVTVTTSLNIVGGKHGAYHFTVADEGPELPLQHWPVSPRVPGDVLRFHSQRGLAPAALALDRRSSGISSGLLFLAPQSGPLQDGPMILNTHGKLVWFKPMTGGSFANDFRVQRYRGQPVLTWWQGKRVEGTGYGTDVIYGSNYQKLATVTAGNGLMADPHEFLISPQDTALITASQLVHWNTRSIHGPPHRLVLDSVVQEIDIPTGLVLFQWDSLDHVPIADSYTKLPSLRRDPFDYFHLNSIDIDRDENLVISARDTWAAYKVSRKSGAIIWQLGGKHSSFSLAPDADFAFQHDVRVQAARDRTITMFDDGAGPPAIQPQSRAIKLSLDFRHRTAKLALQLLHVPPLLAWAQGNYQQLPDGHVLVSWGSTGYISEFADRNVVLDAHFVGANLSARVFLFPWKGAPSTLPAVAASRAGSRETVYASWNGATQTRYWRVLAGPSPRLLRAVRTAAKSDFETAVLIPDEACVAVQALDSSRRVLATSHAVTLH